MDNLSTNFRRAEFACKCGCGQDTVDAELLTVLQWLRDQAGRPVVVHSGNRCPAYNIHVGGATRSQHLRGRAADITVSGLTAREIYTVIDRVYPDRLGLIEYAGFVHVDSRNFRYRDQK